MRSNECLGLIGLLMLAAVGPVVAAEVAPPGFTRPPTAVQAGALTKIEFAMNVPTDVEVAIVDAQGKVVRHLAAGVLGGENPPPAPLKPGLVQSLEWDGKDDYGEKVSGVSVQVSGKADTGNLKPDTSFSVRVRAGMGVKLDKIVGGDPYAFYSKEMGQGDHAAWRLMGLEAKPDGTVYVLANANNYGPAALRAYSASGEYLRTVFPPPAGRKPDEVRGWGIIEKPDGTYAFQYNDLNSPALSTTPICGARGRIARLLPSVAGDELLLEYEYKLMKVRTDGTVAASPVTGDLLVSDPPIAAKGVDVIGPMQMVLEPGGKHFFLAGVFAASGSGRNRTGAAKAGPWRDGQIYKVDAATRKAEVFFSLPEKDVIADLDARGKSPIADFKYGTYAALQGVAVDVGGHVFVCDRQNKRVLVLDSSGKILREIPVEHPDAIAVHPKTRALYVTTRMGHYHGGGELKLLKFNDWSKDVAPSATLPLCPVQAYDQATYLRVVEKGDEAYLWVAYTALPVRIYRDKGAELELVKDFYEAGPQRALDLQHFLMDQKTDTVYVSDGFHSCFRISDWSAPRFVRCMQDEKTPLGALSLAIDSRNRYLYGRADRREVVRYRLDGEFFAPAPVGGVAALTPRITQGWAIGLGFTCRGIAAAPDGSLATLGVFGTGPNYNGPLHFFKAAPDKAPWESMAIQAFGNPPSSGGVRFDPQGNLYAGKVEGKVANPPKGFEKNGKFLSSMGRIYKFAATGSLAGGNLFPAEPAAPAKVYDIHYGPIGLRNPRFGVDGWGRIYYPSGLEPRVSAIDNEGNPVLSFGTYGNRDSMGGLPGNRIPTRDIPLGWPNSVDATDDFIYVSDIVNIRLLRMAKTWAAAETVKLE